ncbi:hypothetical protein ASE17_14390 [Phenylobacterium sp. Root77]|uniref:hypothetical protein n=1 Tax=unclassified Phenylobacterium TaxID=2640670 RepID=UPI0006F7A755|nr:MULTISPECIES: hypothetical protein [unclassified Phenylobacterium]KQW65995.1 hypothetical protein ASC73_19960 [Phenylobacterium sp. Root1277]KQW95704.1 hypothetical protein ASC79_08440 [Phenylobacterium sp. Root1290]KRC41493.1 hypothetical protein ASE17_14390 [Phenylobacterium sp. Root77]
MKKFVLALTAASALAAAAVPAAAQPYGGGYDRHERYDNNRSERLMWRIERAERSGSINSGAASWLRREVSATERLAWRYSRNGFTQWERQDIDRRYDQLARRVDRDDRRYGYGYGNDYRR